MPLDQPHSSYSFTKQYQATLDARKDAANPNAALEKRLAAIEMNQREIWRVLNNGSLFSCQDGLDISGNLSSGFIAKLNMTAKGTVACNNDGSATVKITFSP